MDSYKQVFNSFLSDIANEVDALILDKNAKSLFQKHLDRVFKETEKYGKYLKAEYDKAKTKGLTEYDNGKLKDKNMYWYPTYQKDTTEYFIDDKTALGGTAVCFWMKGQPKLEPLSFVYSMARGSVGKQHKNLTLLVLQRHKGSRI